MIDHPIKFLPDKQLCNRKFMFRMAFVNAVGLCHSIGLAYFGIFDGRPWWTVGKMTRLASLLLDFGYRIGLCLWYLRNSYCCLLPKIRLLFYTVLNYCQLATLRVGLLILATLNLVRRFVYDRRPERANEFVLPVQERFPVFERIEQVVVPYDLPLEYTISPAHGDQLPRLTVRTIIVRQDQNDDELVISSWNPYKSLLSGRYEDTTHLLTPLHVKKNTFEFPPLQVSNIFVQPELVGEVNTKLILQGDKSVCVVR